MVEFELLRCPICAAFPDYGQCEPWPADFGPPPFYTTCYKTTPIEHCFGGNGDTLREAQEEWNAEVRRYGHPVGGGKEP